MINKLKKNIFKKSYFSLETFAENILYIIIGFLIILLLLSNRRANNYQDIISNVNLENQEFKSKSLKNGEKLYEQEQIILSQKEAIKNGLLELENLKKIESQVKIVTVTKIDTVLISHIDTVIRKIDGSDYLKLPQNYNFGNDFFNFDANIDVNGLFVNNINIYNETKINVGYKSLVRSWSVSGINFKLDEKTNEKYNFNSRGCITCLFFSYKKIYIIYF
jgi:hypothetical protein